MRLPAFFILDFEKEKEYKEVLEAYNEKSKEKALLVNRLIEVSIELIFSTKKKRTRVLL